MFVACISKIRQDAEFLNFHIQMLLPSHPYRVVTVKVTYDESAAVDDDSSTDDERVDLLSCRLACRAR